MTYWEKRLIKKTAFFFFILVLSIVFIAGCGALSSLKKGTKKVVTWDFSSSDGLIKKVGILPAWLSNSENEKALMKDFYNRLIEALSNECSSIQLVTIDMKNQPSLYADLASASNNLDMAEKAGNSGLQAVIIARLYNMFSRTQPQGFLWFKEPETSIDIAVNVEMMSTITGAKLLDRTYTSEIELKDEILDGTEGSAASTDYFEPTDAVSDMASDAGESLCEILTREPWWGKVVEAGSEGIVVSGGSAIGLSVGKILEVYEIDRTVSKKTGQQFNILYPVVGEVRIVEVKDNSAMAEIISDNGIKTGFRVRIK